MKNTLQNYTYTTLRYIHDITTGEFINVGVALYSPTGQFAGAKIRTTTGRLHQAFPSLDSKRLIKKLKNIQSDFKKYSDIINSQLSFEKYDSIINISRNILPLDDSSLQWSDIGAGRCVSPKEELDKLYSRLVALYDTQHTNDHRNEDDIWRSFKLDLKKRNLLQHFGSKTISVKDDEMEFHNAWKNSQWHCVEPVSFDLSSPNTIKDKAHKWLGQITSIQNTQEKFKLYLLLGKPQDKSLEDAFNNALSILEKIPGDKLIFKEQESNKLLDILDNEAQKHFNR